jgi:hypothetical protein
MWRGLAHGTVGGGGGSKGIGKELWEKREVGEGRRKASDTKTFTPYP